MHIPNPQLESSERPHIQPTEVIDNVTTAQYQQVTDWHLPTLPIDKISGKSVRVENGCEPIRNVEHDQEGDFEADVLVAEPEVFEPPMYAVVMFNDDYTPMEFVVLVLMSEFRHNEDQAVQIMYSIHNTGKGVAGIYPKDIAETKARKVNNLAKREGFPLLTQIEPSSK